MGWKDDVINRFSGEQDADKWDRMYAADTANLDDHNYRLRRNYTVDYLVNHYDTTAKICDVGCGAGPVTYEMLRRGYDIVGLDYSRDMLDNAARRLAAGQLDRKPLINGNSEFLPFEDDVFDCVVCLGVISYVEHYENIVREIHRILKPGGRALISFRSRGNLLVSDPVYLGYSLAKRLVSLRRKRPFEIGHHMRAAEVRARARDSGFVYTGFKGIGFGPFSLAHRHLFSGRTSIRISDFITRQADRLKAEFLFRLATDVNILLFRKPEKAGAGG
ncbi:MAG: class I SAM-dependent methyltransferase [Gammaproteobacteria bacterium]|jgi:ubiquinone/menaquinone biosynthesis C-methylase UbiE